jgi:hypothetical protein
MTLGGFRRGFARSGNWPARRKRRIVFLSIMEHPADFFLAHPLLVECDDFVVTLQSALPPLFAGLL